MLKLLVSLVGLLVRSHTGLLAGNMAFRHQLSVLQRTARRLRLKTRDRVFWVCVSKTWPRGIAPGALGDGEPIPR